MIAGSRTIGLDGVVAQQGNYRRFGFVSAGRTVRYTGTILAGPAEGLTACVGLPVAAADRAATGVERPAFLEAWLRDTPNRRSLWLRRDGLLDGFGTVRRCREGLKIGPLTAASPADARRLARALASLFPDRPISLDVPDTNPAATELAESFAMRPSFETARMYRGARPPSGKALEREAGMGPEVSYVPPFL